MRTGSCCNRMRERIRKDILATLGRSDWTSTQQRAAVDRVVLCVQQDGVCPLCGNQRVNIRITPEMAAAGTDCEIAHIIPRASGGHNGLSNIVLSHTACNREMGRRTPRQYWSDGDGFEEGMRWVEGIYGEVNRPKPGEVKNAKGPSLWACYFDRRDDRNKIERFKKDVSDQDVQGMTNRQEAATKYAARQVMAYLSDALYDGKGLPERSTGNGGDGNSGDNARKIFTGDGLWTSRLRREWGLFFDTHGSRSHDLTNEQEQERKEKNRGDHHHHAIDAVVIAIGTRSVQKRWEDREKDADAAYWQHAAGQQGRTSYDDFVEDYRSRNRLRPPSPFDAPELSVEDAISAFRERVRRAVFGEDGIKPICHRPVKRKLTGALHEESLFGPVLDKVGNLTDNYTAKKSVLLLTPNHLRQERPETEKEAIDRLAIERMRTEQVDEKAARKWAREHVKSPAYSPAIIDPPPGKSGIVRDRALRNRLRACLEENNLDPDKFTDKELRKLVDEGKIRQASGVPIRSVVCCER